MNDKIKELAELAEFMDSWFSENGDDCETEIRKFANLIIKECILTMESEDSYYGEWMGNVIMTHFNLSRVAVGLPIDEETILKFCDDGVEE